MNVTELARRLKITTAEFLEKLPQLGFDIGKKAIKINPDLVGKIIAAFEADRQKKNLLDREEKIKEIRLDNREAGGLKNLKGESVSLPEVIIVKDLADKLKLPVTKVMAELMKNGIMISLNERLDFTTASIIVEDLGFKAVKTAAGEEESRSEDSEKKLKDILKEQSQLGAALRPPVVVVMGHVDHGKTKLLDAIRQSNVAEHESGGITQHIGAYQVKEKGKLITFLDTPGHEAFKSMRSRGSKVADLAIIVVAADDGLQPQTLEVINLVQREELPFIIAINKIDKEGADIDRVKKELAEINLIPEEWGGKTVCALISAKQKTGITELLDLVLLVADLEEFKTSLDVPAMGTIIESHIDKGEGPVATVLVQTGILKVGDLIAVGQVAGKIRSLKDFHGLEVPEARPSAPVKILGLKDAPQVGDILEVTTDKKRVKELLRQANYKKDAELAISKPQVTKEEEVVEDKPTLPVILKTDVLGSQEAIAESLSRFGDPEVKLKVVRQGLGMVTDADVLEAQAIGGIVIAFRVKNQPSAETLKEEKGVEVLYFEIIYKLLEEIERRLKKLLKPEVIRTELGTIQVLAIFRTEKKAMIAGGKILAGKVKSQTKIKVLRAGQLVTTGELKELRSGKQAVAEAVQGEQCGFKFIGEPVLKEHDVLEVYQEEVKERELIKNKS